MSEQHSTKTTPACPACGSEAVIPIIYGMPGMELARAKERGEIALGGCVVSPDMPHWKCRMCEAEFNLRAAPRHAPSAKTQE